MLANSSILSSLKAFLLGKWTGLRPAPSRRLARGRPSQSENRLSAGPAPPPARLLAPPPPLSDSLVDCCPPGWTRGWAAPAVLRWGVFRRGLGVRGHRAQDAGPGRSPARGLGIGRLLLEGWAPSPAGRPPFPGVSASGAQRGPLGWGGVGVAASVAEQRGVRPASVSRSSWSWNSQSHPLLPLGLTLAWGFASGAVH